MSRNCSKPIKGQAVIKVATKVKAESVRIRKCWFLIQLHDLKNAHYNPLLLHAIPTQVGPHCSVFSSSLGKFLLNIWWQQVVLHDDLQHQSFDPG